MKCDEFLALIHDFVDNECDAKTEKQMKEHLAGCPACKKAVKEMETLKKLVSDAGEIAVPENMAAEAIGAIEAEIESIKPRFTPRSILKAWPVFVTLAACFLLFFVQKASYQRQFQSYIYSQENGAVVVNDAKGGSRARSVDGRNSASSYTPVTYLAKHTITFVVAEPMAEAVFNGAKANGTDAVIRALSEKGYVFAVTYSVAKDCTEEYNTLLADVNSIYQKVAEGDTSVASLLTQTEAQINSLRNDCAVPELKISVVDVNA